MERTIRQIALTGFKSIQALEPFEIKNLNVLIGANGAGKSNFIDFFRMLRAFADEAFQPFVIDSGGGDALLFHGPKVTSAITSRIDFGQNSYSFTLKPTPGGSLQFTEERIGYSKTERLIQAGGLESALKSRRNDRSDFFPGSKGIGHYVSRAVSSWTVYHFHDTSPLSAMRRDQPLRDWDRFRHDASNIAAYLFRLQKMQRQSYALIRDTVRLIAPFFDDFLLRPETRGPNERIRLEWQQKGSDFPFQPGQFSDGTLRFICLATALLQPSPPSTVVIDEPELGLHPYAISILAGLIKSAAQRTQLIISTQSPLLVDNFTPDDVIVVNRQNGRSTFERLNSDTLKEWLEEYSVGELWQKDVVRGGPVGE